MADTATATAALKSYADIPVLDWDLQDPHASSYELFRDLREKTPLVKVPMGMGSMVMGLHARMVDDIVSPENTRQLETEMKMMQGIFDGPIFDFIAQVMLFANGDVHQRRRQPVARTFAFKLMEAMRPKAVAVAAEIINEHLGKGPFDFLKEFAAQIPARIIADILGIPRADLPVFMKWISDTAEAIGFVDVSRRAAIEQSLTEFNAYVDKLLNDRRANPREDFLSDYVAATAASGDLSEIEIRTQIVGLILAGSDTTRNSMCMSLYQLLQHPEQWAALVADPDGLKKKASEEGLRFEPVVSGIPRVTTKDLEIEGYLIPAGAVLMVSILSVLRDPEVYADPESFNIHRTDQQRWHLAFGAGAHRCAGEALARVELEETLATIARLAPKTRIVGAPPKLQPGAIRTVDQIQVEFIA
ncbi:MAG TPA: cytochrome P450 [Hyphomonadaceae bacterium]|nr:cytochrome P450 [Hyphomonadaceae bacterium]HPN05955.1 cytochrome P450 [Hyphomonadaceae bacterium]